MESSFTLFNYPIGRILIALLRYVSFYYCLIVWHSFFTDSVLLDIISDLVFMRRQFVSSKYFVKPQGSNNISGMSIFHKSYNSWYWTLLSLLFNSGISYFFLGLDGIVSCCDDDTVFGILKFYAQMQSFKVWYVIFKRIHFLFFY